MAGKPGNPVRQDPDVDKLFRAMKSLVELTRDLEDRLPSGTYLYLRASALGAMETYAQITGKPLPIEMILTDLEDRIKV
jgi:hypothetical protein